MSTAKKLIPRYPVGDVEASEELNAGPVPAIVWPLTLAALLTTAKSETSTVAAMTILISVCLWFIYFPVLDFLRLKTEGIKMFKQRRVGLSVFIWLRRATLKRNNELEAMERLKGTR